VAVARERQLARLAGTGVYANGHMSARHLRRLCSLDADATAFLDKAYERMRLSARACDRVLKVAQTIADLEAAPSIAAAHVAESLSYRHRSHYDR
jgi:magnesium chelatase family protein